MENFQELGLPSFLDESLHHMCFKVPTPVQAQAIPPGLKGRDVIASAQTGTGKTAAFGIPLLVFLDAHPDQTALILTPTRELAVQVLDVLKKLMGHKHLHSVLLIGGLSMEPQTTALGKHPRLTVGTPGRINDHLDRGTLDLSHAGFLVLDEADRMLDMGFAPQLERIRKRLPTTRQTLLFSATLPPNIRAMGSLYLKDPVRIAVGETDRPVDTIRQEIIHTSDARKMEELVGELKERQGSVLLFARTQSRVDRLHRRLKEMDFKVTRIHGGRTQSQRRNAIEQFRDGMYRILAATDIAARGLDILHIAHVINYDLPRNPEDYIHRVGRTARAGAIGASLSFLTPEDRDLWGRIVRMMDTTKDSIVTKPSRFKDHAPASAPPQPHRPPAHPPSTPSRHPGPYEPGSHYPIRHARSGGGREQQNNAPHDPKRFHPGGAPSGMGHGSRQELRNKPHHDPRGFHSQGASYGHGQGGGKGREQRSNRTHDPRGFHTQGASSGPGRGPKHEQRRDRTHDPRNPRSGAPGIGHGQGPSRNNRHGWDPGKERDGNR